MDPITIMVASIGMQFFNNYANNKKNEEIQAQQREFEKAAAVHGFERMRKAQAAAAKLALEIEAEVHQERVEDIENSYDTLLKDLAHDFTISNWPLTVLPFIMKGESFGSLFGGASKSISMHCIFTPSNCQWFNEYFYDDLDLRIEAEMNNNWNAQSTHPIVYYGGGWNRRQNKPNGLSIPSIIDLDDIALLKNKLKQIPTMIITPYFDPYLYFRVQLWGMGEDSNNPFRIDIPHGEIESKQRIFSNEYNKDCQQELTDDFFNSTMEEFVPYIEKLIGFVADKYFWNIYGVEPIYPEIAHRQKLLYFDDSERRNLFKNLIESADKNLIVAHGAIKLFNVIRQSIDVKDEAYNYNLIVDVLCRVCNSKTEDDICHPDNLYECLICGYWGMEDIPFLKDIISIIETFHNINSKELYKTLSSLVQKIISDNDKSISHFFPYVSLRDFLDYIQKNINGDLQAEDIVVLDLFPNDKIVSVCFSRTNKDSNSPNPAQKYNYRIDGFLVPMELKEKSPKRLKIKRGNIQSFMDKISLDCDTNLFQMEISMNIIVKYCEELIENIKQCSLSIKNGIPDDVTKNIDRNLLDNLIFCEIEGWNNERVRQIFYYDDMDDDLKKKFLVTNNLIIQ